MNSTDFSQNNVECPDEEVDHCDDTRSKFSQDDAESQDEDDDEEQEGLIYPVEVVMKTYEDEDSPETKVFDDPEHSSDVGSLHLTIKTELNDPEEPEIEIIEDSELFPATPRSGPFQIMIKSDPEPSTSSAAKNEYMEKDPLVESNGTTGEQTTKYSCEHCKKEFKSRGTIKKHIKLRHLKVPNKSQNKIEVFTNLCKNIFKGKTLIDKTSTLKTKDLIQLAKELGEKPFQCTLCDYKTVRPGDLRRHTLMKHTTEKPHQCTRCGFRTSARNTLKEHILALHTDQKPHECTLCDYKTARRGSLKEHILLRHTNEKPHKCPLCDFRTAARNSLKGHILAKHTNEKPYQCTMCSHKTVSLSHLKDHILAKHTNEKPHQCNVCDFRTAQRSNLRGHILAKHTAEKPHQCTYCSYATARLHSFKMHMLNKHSDDKPHQYML